jgi:hypothetical protein
MSVSVVHTLSCTTFAQVQYLSPCSAVSDIAVSPLYTVVYDSAANLLILGFAGFVLGLHSLHILRLLSLYIWHVTFCTWHSPE